MYLTIFFSKHKTPFPETPQQICSGLGQMTSCLVAGGKEQEVGKTFEWLHHYHQIQPHTFLVRELKSCHLSFC
jgi:hypothetical protein